MSDALPRDGDWRRVSPLTIVAQMIPGLLQAMLPLGAAIYSSRQDEDLPQRLALFAVPLLVLVVGIVLLSAWLRWKRLRYRVGEADIRVEKGLLSRSARAVPYERIQDVSLEQKLVPRLLGLVEVRFETGAGGKDDLALAYVREAEGERLRETVRALVDGHGLAENATTERDAASPDEEGRTIFAMGPRRLLTFGLFEFSLVVFGILGAASQQLDVLLPFDLWDIEAWEERLAGPGAWVTGLGAAAQLVGALAAIFGLVLVGLATGLVRTVLRDYDFLLQRTARGFRRRRGLLTRTDVVMPVHRVQALVVKTGALRRIWGWHGLSFISLAQDSGSANHSVAPFAQMSEIAPIVSEAGFALPSPDMQWQRPSGDYYFDRAVFAALVPATGAIVGFLAGSAEGLLVAAALVLLAGALALREWWLWRHDRYAIDNRQVFSRRGALAPRLQAASRVKLHSAEIAQGPLGRWRGYATLRFGLAGGRLAFHGLRPDQARQMRAAVPASIAAVDFTRLPG